MAASLGAGSQDTHGLVGPARQDPLCAWDHYQSTTVADGQAAASTVVCPHHLATQPLTES